MANEITKVTDKNNVDHPLRDAAAQTALTGILNGQSIDSFGDVESALTGKFPRSEQAVLGAKNIGLYEAKALYGNAQEGYYLSDTGSVLIAKIEHNTDYIASKKLGQGDRFRIVLFSNKPSGTADTNALEVISDETKTNYEFNSENYNYAVFAYVSANISPVPQDTAEAMIRLASDTDDTYVPYAKTNRELTEDVANKADISSIGTNESGTTASRAYAVGEHFYKNGKFCTAKTAIASGATFTLGTNYVEGTIADILGEEELSYTIGSDFEGDSNTPCKVSKLFGNKYAVNIYLKFKSNMTGSAQITNLLVFDNTSVRFVPLTIICLTNKGHRMTVQMRDNIYYFNGWLYENVEANEWFALTFILERTA